MASFSMIAVAETATETQTQQRLNQNLQQQMGPAVPSEGHAQKQIKNQHQYQNKHMYQKQGVDGQGLKSGRSDVRVENRFAGMGSGSMGGQRAGGGKR
ncbi:MAG TPA: hypothetical protein ENK73_00155 [Thiomicrospira sp.]|nr:hypothetical protein [Thiomicrospira sp.]